MSPPSLVAHHKNGGGELAELDRLLPGTTMGARSGPLESLPTGENGVGGPSAQEAHRAKMKRSLILAIDVGDELTLPSKQHRGKPTSPAGSRHDYIKWVALATLFFQNSGTSLLMPLAQKGAAWNSQSGVIVQEAIKGTLCILMLLQEGGARAVVAALRPTPEAVKTAAPALLFLIQNNLQYVAAKHLDAATFAVLYQLKTLTTALLSMLMLGKRLGLAQWLALFILVGGAVCMVLDRVRPGAGASSEGGEKDVITGVVAVLSSCTFSGMAGVYFEKILKDSAVSLAARNVQLAGYSCTIGLISWYQSGGEPLQFFSGYSPLVWLSICNNAFGGLLVAVTVKYADNILKNFANTLAIVNVTVVSTAFLGGSLGAQSALGVGMVISSIFVYADLCKQDSLTNGMDSACGQCLGLKAFLTAAKAPCAPLGGKARHSPRQRTPKAGESAGESAV